MARYLVRAILPQALPDGGTPEELFNGRVDRAALDRAGSNVRIRLRSMAVRVEHEGGVRAGPRVVVHYLQPDGARLPGACGPRRHGRLGCRWRSISCRNSRPPQIAALEEYRYTAVLYINVLLCQWRPIADLRLCEMWLPGGYCQNMFISDPLRVGKYRPEYRPDRPTVLTLHKNLYASGKDPEEQMLLTRTEMETTPFATYERRVREELTHLFGPWGFRAADDIMAITVNRWAHGYTFSSLPGERKSLRKPGRAKLGRISFAGADAAGVPWTQSAMYQGHRAAMEQM